MMDARARNWRSIREAAASYDAPDHLGDEAVRRIAEMLNAGVAPFCEDQAAMGPLPEWAKEGA